MTEEEPPTTNLTGLTWDEFLALPYETRNASLINGEVVVNSPNAQHEAREVLALRLGPEGPPYHAADLDEKDTLTSPLLDGFSVAVADLFSRRQPRTGDDLS